MRGSSSLHLDPSPPDADLVTYLRAIGHSGHLVVPPMKMNWPWEEAFAATILAIRMSFEPSAAAVRLLEYQNEHPQSPAAALPVMEAVTCWLSDCIRDERAGRARGVIDDFLERLDGETLDDPFVAVGSHILPSADTDHTWTVGRQLVAQALQKTLDDHLTASELCAMETSFWAEHHAHYCEPCERRLEWVHEIRAALGVEGLRLEAADSIGSIWEVFEQGVRVAELRLPSGTADPEDKPEITLDTHDRIMTLLVQSGVSVRPADAMKQRPGSSVQRSWKPMVLSQAFVGPAPEVEGGYPLAALGGEGALRRGVRWMLPVGHLIREIDEDILRRAVLAVVPVCYTGEVLLVETFPRPWEIGRGVELLPMDEAGGVDMYLALAFTQSQSLPDIPALPPEPGTDPVKCIFAVREAILENDDELLLAIREADVVPFSRLWVE